jgi:hypothetical protein
MAALPEDTFEPETLTLIHQMTGGVPGDINKFCAGALARAGTQARMRVMPPTPEPAPAIGQGSRLPQATSGEIVTAEATTAPMIERQHGAGQPAELVVTPQEVRYEPEHPPWRVRRLQRSVQIWRALAILVSVALAVELTPDAWLDHMPTNFASLWSLAEPPSEPAEPQRLQDPVQSTALDSPTDPAEPTSNTQSDFAALHAPTFLREDAEMPQFPNTINDSETPLPQSTTTTPVTSESVLKPGAGLAADTPRQDAKTDQVGSDSVRASARPVPGSPGMTRAQRREIARLYAERAEYELRKGEEGAASLSIQRGLSNDPGNPRLLEMRAKVLEALRQP